jgi:hypothetical protein
MNSSRMEAWLTAAVMTSLLTAACGGGSGGGGTTVPAGLGLDPHSNYTLTVDPNPVKAIVATDDSRATSQDISAQGGLLQATGSDGTVYTLSVPEGALADTTHITMAPIKSVQGTPFGDQARGVKLGPDGLRFLLVASLRVTPPEGQDWPVAQQVPLGIHDSDGVASLAPLDPASQEAVFQLTHFSSYALLLATKGLNASLEAVRHRLGGDAEARLETATAETLANLRQTQQAVPPTGDMQTEMAGLLSAYDTQVVKPRIAAAGSSCAAGRLAIQTAISFERTRELLGMPGQSMDELLGGFLDTATTVCMKEEFEICRDQHIITRMAPAMLGILRQYQLIDRPVPSTVDAYAGKCLRFELIVDSSAHIDGGDPSEGSPLRSASESVHGNVLITYRSMFPSDTAQLTYSALLLMGDTAPLVPRNYQVASHDPCKTVSAPQSVAGQITADMLDWTVTPGSVAERTTVQDFRLTVLVPYPVTTNYRLTDCKTHDVDTYGDTWDTFGLFMQAQDAGVTGTKGPAMVGWTIGSGELLATKRLDLSESDGKNTERMEATLELRHRPASE